MSAGTGNSRLFAVFKWLSVWIGITAGITLAGAVLGALLFPVGGVLFGYQVEIQTMAWNGLQDGGFLAFIWAPGISFVICVMLIRNKYVKSANNHS